MELRRRSATQGPQPTRKAGGEEAPGPAAHQSPEGNRSANITHFKMNRIMSKRGDEIVPLVSCYGLYARRFPSEELQLVIILLCARR